MSTAGKRLQELLGILHEAEPITWSMLHREGWDGRVHKIMPMKGTVYHGTSETQAQILTSPQGPTHPDLDRFKVRRWVGPVGFYVTTLLDRAKDYARANAVAFQNSKSKARVLSWDATELGLKDVLICLRDPTETDILLAKRMKLSGIRGPGIWGALVFKPRPVPGKIAWSAE